MRISYVIYTCRTEKKHNPTLFMVLKFMSTFLKMKYKMNSVGGRTMFITNVIALIIGVVAVVATAWVFWNEFSSK